MQARSEFSLSGFLHSGYLGSGSYPVGNRSVNTSFAERSFYVTAQSAKSRKGGKSSALMASSITTG